MTALQRWADPFSAFDDLFVGFNRDFASPTRWARSDDVEETDESFIIRCDMPGVDPKDFTVEVHGDTLSIKGQRKTEHRANSYSRAYTLPRTVALDKVDAAYEHGVLTVTIPKREEARPRMIEVKVR